MASSEDTDAVKAVVSGTFGYYPVPCDIAAKRFSIETLPDYSIAVSEVAGDSYVYKGWVYPGPQSQVDIGSGRTHAMPYSARVFGLPKTHRLVLRQSKEPADLDFVVWCLSFFTGMRLTTTEAGFLDATPATCRRVGACIHRLRTPQSAFDQARGSGRPCPFLGPVPAEPSVRVLSIPVHGAGCLLQPHGRQRTERPEGPSRLARSVDVRKIWFAGAPMGDEYRYRGSPTGDRAERRFP